MSSLTLGLNQVEIKRGLTTSSVAIFVPFTTQELFQTGGARVDILYNAVGVINLPTEEEMAVMEAERLGRKRQAI